MSYTITISGHQPAADQAEQEANEQAAVEKARTFAQSLDGVSAAYIQTSTTGHVNLLEQPA